MRNCRCGAARQTGHSLHVQNLAGGELVVCRTKLTFATTARRSGSSDIPFKYHVN